MNTARLITIAMALLTVFAAADAKAHSMRSAYLEIRERAPSRYLATWSSMFQDPAIGPAWPADCSVNRQTAILDITCQSPLKGRALKVDGLGAKVNEAIVKYISLDDTTESHVLTASNPTWSLPSEPDAANIATSYAGQGVWHILLGPDHLLFLLALVLIVRNPRKIIVTATAFTLAHSLSLAASILGIVTVSGAAVEACIALSLILVALDIGRRDASRANTGPLLGFGFGLVHGFGFAGALTEVGLPATDIPLALATFNIGVEVGQIAFIAALLLAMRASKSLNLTRQLDLIAAYGVGAMGVFWLLERTTSVL